MDTAVPEKNNLWIIVRNPFGHFVEIRYKIEGILCVVAFITECQQNQGLYVSRHATYIQTVSNIDCL